MYIEFKLPTGAGGIAAGHALNTIRGDIEIWARQHNIHYKTKLHKYTLRLCLSTDKEYTQFALSWSPKHDVSKYFGFIQPK